MLVSTLAIRCDSSATVACIFFNASSEGGGDSGGAGAGGGAVGAGSGGGLVFVTAGLDGGVLFSAAGLAAGGVAMSIPVACLNMASISDCGSTLPSLLIACSVYYKKIYRELYSARGR